MPKIDYMAKRKVAKKSVNEKKIGGFTQFQLILIFGVFVLFVLFFLL